MLKWKDEYLIGVELIDAQHQRLFEIGNSAYELLKDEFSMDKYDDIVMIIEDLKQYTKFHFKTEEDYMLEIKHSKYFSQKVEHDEFIEKLDEFNFSDIDKDQKKYLDDMLAFIFNWILNHILEKDMLIKLEKKSL